MDMNVPEEGIIILIGIDNEGDLYIEKTDAQNLRRILVNEGFEDVPLYDDYGILNSDGMEDVSGLDEMQEIIETGEVIKIYSIQIL